ncbi:hypothetical protein DA075_07940 [Methylobacterium currus]|uniref:Uncharacterized protein n=1 Tax=Methylobacterium currus TaxID=2051553 RepID=A0A2R4WH32_9HYPH|nr:hypothetical protein [Methylobacterium currus]AWB20851.1 hypothetical protein DA075_07940 [Methylobacterium currus]
MMITVTCDVSEGYCGQCLLRLSASLLDVSALSPLVVTALLSVVDIEEEAGHATSDRWGAMMVAV